MLAAVIIFCTFSVYFQLAAILFTGLLTLLYMRLYMPFVQQKENIAITILEVGFVIACIQVPFFVEKTAENIMPDVFVYTLMSASILSSLVSLYYSSVGCYRRCKERQKERQRRRQERDRSNRFNNLVDESTKDVITSSNTPVKNIIS